MISLNNQKSVQLQWNSAASIVSGLQLAWKMYSVRKLAPSDCLSVCLSVTSANRRNQWNRLMSDERQIRGEFLSPVATRTLSLIRNPLEHLISSRQSKGVLQRSVVVLLASGPLYRYFTNRNWFALEFHASFRDNWQMDQRPVWRASLPDIATYPLRTKSSVMLWTQVDVSFLSVRRYLGYYR